MSRGKEVKELREKMGMNRREFSDYYGIPYRTIQDWEAGEFYQIEDCNKMIYIGSDLPDEYTHSNYTQILKGANAKAKANATQGLPELLKIATNEVYEDNRKEKHSKDAKYGWYSYDSRFALPVFGDDGEIERYNVFNVAMLVRHDENGKYYLYDIMKIKKKRAIFSSQMTLLSNKTHFLII